MQDEVYENRPPTDDESSVSHLRLVNVAMESWAVRWMILPDGRVGCAICSGTQAADDAWLPFAHDVECRHHGATVQQPWLYLRAHLSRLSKEPK
jgi:hypothetical protein